MLAIGRFHYIEQHGLLTTDVAECLHTSGLTSSGCLSLCLREAGRVGVVSHSISPALQLMCKISNVTDVHDNKCITVDKTTVVTNSDISSTNIKSTVLQTTLDYKPTPFGLVKAI